MGFSPIQFVLAAAGGSIAIFANFVAVIMVGKVNGRVPENDRISYVWWSSRVVDKYRQLYPTGRLALLLRVAEVSLVVWFLVSAFLIFPVRS
jgi:hypothetical protein